MSIDVTWVCTYCGAVNKDVVYVSTSSIHNCRKCGKPSEQQADYLRRVQQSLDNKEE